MKPEDRPVWERLSDPRDPLKPEDTYRKIPLESRKRRKGDRPGVLRGCTITSGQPKVSPKVNMESTMIPVVSDETPDSPSPQVPRWFPNALVTDDELTEKR